MRWKLVRFNEKIGGWEEAVKLPNMSKESRIKIHAIKKDNPDIKFEILHISQPLEKLNKF